MFFVRKIHETVASRLFFKKKGMGELCRVYLHDLISTRTGIAQ